MTPIHELLQLCLDKTANTSHDVFFSYSAHVSWIDVYYYRNGKQDQESYVGIGYADIDNDEEINFLIEKVKELV